MPHKSHSYTQLLGVIAALFLALVTSTQAATSVSLTWNASSDPAVTGYNVLYGSASGNYTNTLNVGNLTSAALSGLTSGATYYAVVIAYNAANLQSLPSNEISFTVPDNIPPTVTLTSPTSGSSFTSGTPISMVASAADADGSITKVEFYADTTMVGQQAAAPYAVTWSNPSTGSHLLTAVAYDDAGAAVRSAPVGITVSGPSPSPTPATTTPTTPRATTVVSVTAVRAKIYEGGIATFRLVTSRANSQDTVINYQLWGTAVAGVNYDATGLTGQVVIPAGLRSAFVNVNTLKIDGRNPNTKLILTLMPDSSYLVGLGTAAVVILNSGSTVAPPTMPLISNPSLSTRSFSPPPIISSQPSL